MTNKCYSVKFRADGSNYCRGMFYARLDHPQRVFGGLHDSAKSGWNQCSDFDNMLVQIFCALCFKMPIHTPK